MSKQSSTFQYLPGVELRRVLVSVLEVWSEDIYRTKKRKVYDKKTSAVHATRGHSERAAKSGGAGVCVASRVLILFQSETASRTTAREERRDQNNKNIPDSLKKGEATKGGRAK